MESTKVSSTAKSMLVAMAKASLNGKAIDCSQLVTLGGGKATEAYFVVSSVEEAYKIAGTGEDAWDRLSPFVATQYLKLVAAGMTTRRAALTAFFRGMAILLRFVPATVKELGLPILEVATVDAYTDTAVATMKLVNEEVAAVYGSVDGALADFPHMIAIASYFRQHFIHLWISSGAHERKFEKLRVACRASSGTEKLLMFDEVVMRSVCHVMGFKPLYNAATLVIETVSEPIRLRFWTAPAGASLVPTTNAILQSFCADPANAGKAAHFKEVLALLEQESTSIRACPPLFAQHANLYGLPSAMKPVSISVCKAMAPMLSGWLASLTQNTDLKNQFVLRKDAAQAPETVAYFERAFAQARKKLAEADNLDALVSKCADAVKALIVGAIKPDTVVTEATKVKLAVRP